MNNQSPMATGSNISSRSPVCDSFFQPFSSYSRSVRPRNHHVPKQSPPITSNTIPSALWPAPRKYKKHQSTALKVAPKPANRQSCSPLTNIQYRARPSSGLTSSSRSYSLSRNGLLQTFALGVVDFGFTEEAGLGFDLGAVADDHDLHVGGIEVFAGGFEQIGRR